MEAPKLRPTQCLTALTLIILNLVRAQPGKSKPYTQVCIPRRFGPTDVTRAILDGSRRTTLPEGG